ncbi:MAG: hypothetical protein R2863_11330 [Candidatus Kapaibacterium sp.]
MSDSGIRPLRPSDTPPEVGNEMVEDVGNSPPLEVWVFNISYTVNLIHRIAI